MEKIVLDDFLKFHAISDLAWAPDGQKAVFLVHKANQETNGYDTNLWLYTDGEKAPRQLTGTGDILSFVWDSNDTLLFSALREEREKALRVQGEDCATFYSLPLYGGSAIRSFSVPLNAKILGKLEEHTYLLQARVNLMKNARLQNLTGAARATELANMQEENARFTIFDEYPFWANGAGITNKTRCGLWLYNSLTERLTQITDPLFDVVGAVVDQKAGKVVYHGTRFDTIGDYRTGIWVYDYASAQQSCVVEQGLYRLRQLAWMGDRVVFAGTDMAEYSYSQTPALWTVEPTTKEITRLGTEAMSIGNPVGSDTRYGGGCCLKAEGDRLYLISGIEDSSRLIVVEASGEIVSLVEKAGSVDLFDVHDGKILFVGMQDMRLQELYRYNEASWNRISAFNEAYYQTHSIVQPEELRFTDPDGFVIHGFVLRPVGYDPTKRYPAILDIHGGPRLSYGAVYYHEMQVWANQGYFVFFANPRGSDARGDEFAFIRGKYGTVEYQNLMDFTDQVLAAYPQIDREHLGAAGGSYGGFMINWIIGNTHRFAAAASQRSIANFISMEGTSDCGRTFLEGHLGAKTQDSMMTVWNQSPIKYAHQCTTPTLFIHAEEDYRCWKVEALQMFTAIRANGVDARLCLFKGENHELSRAGKPKNRQKRLVEITNWMDKYLKPSKASEDTCR